jgi:hypothetical protein
MLKWREYWSTLELASDLSWEIGVSEMAEHCEKVPCNSVRPHVDFIPGGSVTGTRLTHADTCINEHASGVLSPLIYVDCFTTTLDLLD